MEDTERNTSAEGNIMQPATGPLIASGPHSASRPPSPHQPPPTLAPEGSQQSYPGEGMGMSQAATQDSSGAQSGAERPLNVSDALSYLDQVKLQFSEMPDVYNKFLDIMKDFKSQLIDTPGVIERVSNLFHGHPALIQGFNTFLPAGYRIETTAHPDPNYITVTTPAGTTTQATNGAFNYASGNIPAAAIAPAPEKSESSNKVSQETLKPALDYVTRVKTRYANEPEMYRKFLSILSESSGKMQDHKDIRGMESWSVACLSAKYPQGETLRKIGALLQDAPDLMREFIQFLPDEHAQKEELARVTKIEEQRKASESKSKRGGDNHASSSAAVPQKRKRKAVDREKDKEPAAKASTSKKSKVQPSSEAPSPALPQRQAVPPPSPPRAQPQPPPQAFYPHHRHPSQPMPMPQPMPPPLQQSSSSHPSDDRHFFDRVKRAIDNRETYNEFLKLVNLFTQDIINSTRLVRESRSFLGDGELMAQFKAILGWDERKEWIAPEEEGWTRPMGALDRPSREQLHTRYGSYRKLPANEVNVQCSGRDEMCNSVLNDEWISQPTFASEDAGFVAHKKNIYEEALHRSEEERHEYDFHIEAIHRTIQVLEPINSKIMQLTPEERAKFPLKPNLGGNGKAIHQRVIKKIYGRDPGLDVWAAMQEVPGTAIPVVLARLKQKHEEWKRAQREWDKVWREVDLRNYHKSLDHQAVTFKAADKKAITQKTFVSQIEAARDEQRVKRASLIDPLFARTKPRHQLELVVEDTSVLQDTVKLTLSFLDRTQGQIALADRRKIETFLRSFVPLFFMLDPATFNAAFVAQHETVDSDAELDHGADDVEANGTGGSGSRSRNKKGGGGAGDLRKRLLKSEQAKSSRRTRAQEAASPTPSRFASPAPSDSMQVEGESARSENGVNAPARIEKALARRRGSFYTNTSFYVMLRLLELLYSRLQLFKNITKERAENGSDPLEPNPALVSKNIKDDLAKMGDRINHASQFYDLMLESCEKLFDNEMEQHVFEEVMRYMFGLKHGYKLFTVDKVIGALIKQVQVILSDPKSQELYDLLRREREIPSPTTQDLINCRRNTERVLGPDENLFRIDWLPEPKTMTIQLIGKDDGAYDDSEVLTGRWQSYIESFVSHHYTAGVPSASTIRRPFLLRTKIPAPTGAMPEIVARGGLQIKVCVRTYRLFFVSESEDVMFRLSTARERAESRELVEKRNVQRRKWLEDYANRKISDEPEVTGDALAASSAPAAAPATTTPTPAEPPTEMQIMVPAADDKASAPEAPPASESKDVQMTDAEQPEPEPAPETKVYTAPQDGAPEAAVAVAAAVAASAVEPDPEDVPMTDAVTEAPPAALVTASESAPLPAVAPVPLPVPAPAPPKPPVEQPIVPPTQTVPPEPLRVPEPARAPEPTPAPSVASPSIPAEAAPSAPTTAPAPAPEPQAPAEIAPVAAGKPAALPPASTAIQVPAFSPTPVLASEPQPTPPAPPVDAPAVHEPLPPTVPASPPPAPPAAAPPAPAPGTIIQTSPTTDVPPS